MQAQKRPEKVFFASDQFLGSGQAEVKAEAEL